MYLYKEGGDGMVFSMTNAVNNSIVAIQRDMAGMLSDTEVYMTHGNGTGAQMVDPLGSQGSVILSGDGRFLFAVNTGSNNISSFLVQQDSLMLVDVAYSGGLRPNSLATIDNFLYVTNSGNAAHPSNVTGFQVSPDGYLNQISGGTMPLSAANAGPGCVVISHLGHKLVVSEKTTNALSIFQVQSDGTLLLLKIYRSIGEVPFGSAFLNNNLLLVAEAGPNALSSYTIAADGVLNVISDSVLNNQKATCWVSVDPKEKHAYTSNAGSGTITDYLINNDGSLSVVGNIGSTPQGTGAPLDSAIDKSGQNFYVLNGNEGSISVFKIDENRHLSLLQVYKDTTLPQVGAQGLAVL
jgi:6-phosphogluconolactonase (cycloisomerase 2 family)